MTSTQEVVADTNLPAPGTYTVDPIHSTIGFVARHLVASKVRGLFTEFEGTIVIADTPEASSVNATVKAASITTNQEQRDAHLKSPDFLDFENHPELTLVSKTITSKGGQSYALVTDLTLRGVTKEVVFDLEYLGTNPGLAPNTTVAGFEATATIDRRDFNVSFEGSLENGALVVGHKVTLELEIEASKEN
jgi:polyisoprenoid-binding protein YceI